jgi:hypothetical protein
MVRDKAGNEIKVGDEIILRGRVVAIPVEFDFDLKDTGILQVQWGSEEVPVADFVNSSKVEKASQ